MGLGLNIALFVGIPAAVIVGAGFLLNRFRGTITSSATSIGSTLGTIFTAPVAGFIGGVSEQLGGLPDIDIRIPGINVTGGLFRFTQEQSPRDIGGETGRVPGGTVEFEPGTMFDPNTGIISGDPPVITPDQPFIPEAEAAGLTERPGSILIGLPGELSRQNVSDIVRENPEAVGGF